MLAGMNDPLDPPHAPFVADNAASLAGSSRSGSPIRSTAALDGSNVSLSINYLPSKFSSSLLSPGARKRKSGKGVIDPMLPKRGGGVEAFRSGEARMPSQNDDDYDGVSSGWFGGGGKKGGRASPRKLRWNRFKSTLFVANIVLSIYSVTALIVCLLTWFNVWKHADIIRVGNRSELVLSTIAASIGVITSLIGWPGILLNNRSFLAVYTFLLWITFAFLVTPGYITYRRRTFNLQGKINAEWSRALGTSGRLRIQNQLDCCGYYSPFIEATVSSTCYSRSILPGCKLAYLDFERMALENWYIAVFSLVPAHMLIMLAALLCSNHVTYRFGKGMMPKAYRLSMNSMAVIMDNYASQLAEQYGTEVAEDILSRSRSNLQLDAMPTMPYQQSSSSSYLNHAKYDSVGGRAPEGAS